jgi:glycosyltransferase involved in cell wall biosynthesis
VKIALLTTPPSMHSGIADYTRHLLPSLRARAQVQVFVDDEALGEREEELAGQPVAPLSRLDPRRFDRVLYQLGNESRHAYMLRALPRLGGVVVQHDWVLFDLALATYPALVRGGVKGAALAAREGDLRQLRTYAGTWAARRRSHRQPQPAVDPRGHEGPLIGGWHEPEAHGRWIADRASFRLPADDVAAVTVVCNAPVGRRLELLQEGQLLADYRTVPEKRWQQFEVELRSGQRPVLELRVSPIAVTEEQRRHGDARRLGAFVERIEWRDGRGQHHLDLRAAADVPLRLPTLSDARFELPLNGSVLRHADAFLVHSDYLRRRIEAVRPGALVGVVPHGAERRWSDLPRGPERRDLGLPPDWVQSFLITSFGGVQAHKRIDKVLAALALARRERPHLRLVLAGKLSAEGFDAREGARRLGLGSAVHFTGFVSEPDAWRWLHAGDLSINLRGPTSGGTSGGIFQAFGLGRGVIATDAAEQCELPDSCVVKVPLGDDEVPALARTLVQLSGDPERVEALGRAAREYVDQHCHWSHCAEGYLRLLESAPGPRARQFQGSGPQLR